MSQDTRGKREAEHRAAVSAHGLLADDSGAVLMWTIFIALPVFFALGALVVDAHRTYNTFDEAQNFADHTALAAAMELNGRAGAIGRAIQAACGPGPENRPLVRGTHTYGNAVSGARMLATDRLVFLSQLGADPSAPNQYAPAVGDTPICTATCGAPAPCLGLSATLNASARFVEVTTAPVTVDWLLWPVMAAFGVDTLTTADAAARATAGFTKSVCTFPPLWVCNPLQGTSASLGKDYVGVQMAAKAGGGENLWAPGNFGLVEAPGGPGAAEYKAMLTNPSLTPQCINNNLVPFETGSKTGPVEEGFNSRFCGKNNKELEEEALPRDSCFPYDKKDTGTYCQLPGSRTGIGNWNCLSYWTTNHEIQAPASCTATPHPNYTRFDLYKDEIKQGVSTCGDPLPPQNGLGRRDFIIAVVDCDVKYAGRDEAPAVEYVRMFLTEPIGVVNPSDKEIYMEVVGPANAETLSEVFKEYPVLYR
jgi:hypothetical protein